MPLEMSNYTLQTYLKEVCHFISSLNGKGLSSLLYCTDKHASDARLAISEPEISVMAVVPVPWDEIISAHLRCLWALISKKVDEACACQIVLVKALAKIFAEIRDDNWMLPVILVAAVDLRRFATALDAQKTQKVEAKSAYSSHMEQVAQLIMKLFQICAADSRTAMEDSKKCGMMGLANQLFKIYFHINKLNLCKSIIRAIENMNMDSYFSLAQRITFSYYVGRKAMFDGDFRSADIALTFAFERCLQSNTTNKRLILIYLIPVRMLLGIFPQSFILTKYNLKEFAGIAESAKSGNVRLLNSELNLHANFFISCGIYLILERLKMITYRNLFKRVSAILNTHLLPISAFTDILKFMGVEDVDNDETECILANLIYEGKIKGYLAHQQQKLVVSKVQAFPPI